jgi:hypothetical protein
VTVTDDAARQVTLVVDGGPSPGFRRTVGADRIEIRAGSDEGLWAAIVDLERTMALAGSPVLPAGEVERTPAWPVQIGQAPFGANYLVPDLSPAYLSDDAFRLMAHFGLTGMTLYGDWLLYVRSERYPEVTHPEYDANIAMLRDATERAARYGIRLYYVPVSPKLPADHPVFEREPALRGARIKSGLRSDGVPIHNFCSSSPESLAFHAETFASLFREVPRLGGLTLIIGGESYYHCYMRPDRAGLPEGQKTNCPRCAAQTPEQVVAGLLEATVNAVHAESPEALVMAWPYSAFAWSADPDQIDLIRHLPEGVTLLSEIDKDAWVSKDGYEKHIWDYSVDFTGPSARIQRQQEAARQHGRGFAIKSETALGLECIQVSYVPALPRLGTKWGNVRDLAPDAVLQSWMFFGMWGSPAEELGWWTRWRPEASLETVVRQIARRDAGDRADALLGAWAAMSAAAGHLPYISTYFQGPEFIGPCHPLVFDPAAPLPDIFHAALYYLQENEATFGTVARDVRHSLVTADLPEIVPEHRLRVTGDSDGWSVVIDEYGAAAEHAREAHALLEGAVGPGSGPALREQALLVEFLYRTWLTTWQTLRFLRARDRGDHEAMQSIAQQELRNARDGRHLFTDAPWLNLALRLDGDYPDSLAMIDTKIAMLEEALSGAGREATA